MFAFLSALLSIASAETADEVIAKARAANQVTSSIETVRMTLVSKSGSERAKEFELRTRREGEVSKSFMRFTAPSAEAGTMFVQIDNPGPNDEQLLRMPSVPAIQQIASSGRKGAFLGSDFSFEDLVLRASTGGTYTMVEDGAAAWVVETVPSDSSYTKIRTTIDKATLVLTKVEFYGSAGLVKVLEVKATATENGVVLPTITEMTTVAKGTKTRLEVLTHQINVGKDVLPDETFTRGFLERG